MFTIPGKIPIRIYPFFWVLAIVIGWLNSFTVFGTFVWTVVILISVLVHEFGHALTARAFGQRSHIELLGMGGVTHRRGPKLKLWQEFIIVMNGPLAGLLLFAVALQLHQLIGKQAHPFLVSILNVTIYVNLFWTLVNLLPVQPLDGGHLLRIILEGAFGLRGVKVALFISMFVSLSISILFFYIQALLAGSIFLLLTYESFRSWQNSLSVTEEDQNFALQHMLKEAERELRDGHHEEAQDKLQRVREMAKAGVIHQAATQYLADLLHEQGKYREAYDLLNPLKGKLSPESLRLLHQAAYKTGEWEEAIALGNRSYQNYPSYDTALINALCYALLGQARPAVGWLQCALREGLPNLKETLSKREFDKIRNDPLFQQLQNQSPTA